MFDHRSRQFSARFLLLAWFVSVFAIDANAQELDPGQKEWIARYEKQKNVPRPGEMLLNTDAEPDLGEGFVSLFNGTDLAGWKARGGTCSFEVEGATIVGTCIPGSKSTYLTTDRNDFRDFVFTCEWKLEVDGNTGIQFRSMASPGKNKEPVNEVVSGPQVEIEGNGKPGRNWTGGIYGQSCGGYFYPLWLKQHAAARAAEKKAGWNRVTILARGDAVKTWINGIAAAHWVDDGTHSRGFFALQVHSGKAGKIRFKNIRVREE